MSLLARRRALAHKLALKEPLFQALQGRRELDSLFVGAASLVDVIDVLAVAWIDLNPDHLERGQLSLPEVLLCALSYLRKRVKTEQDLTQAEHLVASMAASLAMKEDSVVGQDRSDWAAITRECESFQLLLRQRRRARMNMGSRRSEPQP